MFSTSVYCAIHVNTVLVILIWTPGFTKGVGYCRSNPGTEACSSKKSMFCHPGQLPQIVEAYFVNAIQHTVCESNCKATPAADGDFQCVYDLQQSGLQCVQRLSYTDLGVVYNACAAALSRHCEFRYLSDTNLLSLRSTFTVDYLCRIQEKSTIDPCLTFEEQRSHASLWLPYNTTSCHSVCEITPVNTQRSVYFKYQLIQGFTKSGQVVYGNNITYEITFTPNTGKTPQWIEFHSSYYDDYQLWQDVDKLRIRFNIPRGDVVRHLWISFNDSEVNIACTGHPTSPPDSTRPTPGGPTKSEKGTEMNTSCTSISPSANPPIAGTESNTHSGSVNTASSTPVSIKSIPPEVQTTLTTESGSEDGDQSPTLVVIIVAVVMGVAVATGVLFAVIFIIRKRRDRQKRQDNAETKGDNNESHPENQTGASLPLPNDGDYTECFMTDDSNPDPRDPEAEPIMTTHPRCDVGDEYVTLQRDARVVRAGRSEESENYDHMPVGTRPRSDVYNVLQRDQKKQEVVDNVYNTTSLTP